MSQSGSDQYKVESERILSTSLIPVTAVLVVMAALSSCSTMRELEPSFEKHSFPKNAYFTDVKKPYRTLGAVRSRVDFPTLDQKREERELCENYFNKSVRQLTQFAKERGADAVIQVQSVVFFEDGKREVYSKPECSDDGAEGQVLTQGIAVQWVKTPVELGSWVEEIPSAPTVLPKENPQIQSDESGFQSARSLNLPPSKAEGRSKTSEKSEELRGDQFPESKASKKNQPTRQNWADPTRAVLFDRP